MFDARLPTHLWVGAGLARCSGDGIAAAVVRKGDPHGGLVLARIDLLDGRVRLMGQERDLEGRLVWRIVAEDTPDGEPAVAGYLERAVGRDPDLWVVDIEDRSGRNPFE